MRSLLRQATVHLWWNLSDALFLLREGGGSSNAFTSPNRIVSNSRSLAVACLLRMMCSSNERFRWSFRNPKGAIVTVIVCRALRHEGHGGRLRGMRVLLRLLSFIMRSAGEIKACPMSSPATLTRFFLVHLHLASFLMIFFQWYGTRLRAQSDRLPPGTSSS